MDNPIHYCLDLDGDNRIRFNRVDGAYFMMLEILNLDTGEWPMPDYWFILTKPQVKRLRDHFTRVLAWK